MGVYLAVVATKPTNQWSIWQVWLRASVKSKLSRGLKPFGPPGFVQSIIPWPSPVEWGSCTLCDSMIVPMMLPWLEENPICGRCRLQANRQEDSDSSLYFGLKKIKEKKSLAQITIVCLFPVVWLICTTWKLKCGVKTTEPLFPFITHLMGERNALKKKEKKKEISISDCGWILNRHQKQMLLAGVDVGRASAWRGCQRHLQWLLHSSLI